MPVTFPDQLLSEAGLSEAEARLEIACRLYDAGKLTMPQATRWAEISRTEFENALLERHLPLVRTLRTALYSDRHLHLGPEGYEVFAAKLKLLVEKFLAAKSQGSASGL